MSYIGPAPNPGQNREVDDISSSFNGSTTAFTLQVSSQNVSPGSSNNIIVSLGGVVQNPGTDYNIAASTITFTTAPASGLSFFGLVLGQQVDIQSLADGASPTMSAPTITGDLSIADKIVHTGDTNTAIRFPAADSVRIDTAGSNRFKIDSSGRIGILDPNLDNFDNSADDLVINGTGNTGITINSGAANSTAEGALVFAEGNGTGGSADGFRGAIQYKHGDDRMMFYTDNTERMRLRTSTGGLMINDDSSTRIGEPKLHVLNGGSSNNVASFFFNTTHDRDALIIRHNGCGTQTSTMIKFLNEAGNQCGKIASDTTNTVYLTSSDYRLKENEVLISDGITRLKTLKPYRFNFKSMPSKTVDGFFAHEVTAVPEAISGIKDETENVLYKDDDEIPEGKSIGDVKETVPKYQGIDQSKLVPLLTAALQEAITKIETLETKVAALEAA